MNILKAIGDMKDMASAAPGLFESAHQLAENSKAQGLAAQSASMNVQSFGEPLPAHLEPIGGVALERYAAIVKGIAAYGYDQSKLVEVAASHGVAAGDWLAAQDGWSTRIQSDPALGSRFNQLYTAV